MGVHAGITRRVFIPRSCCGYRQTTLEKLDLVLNLKDSPKLPFASGRSRQFPRGFNDFGASLDNLEEFLIVLGVPEEMFLRFKFVRND